MTRSRHPDRIYAAQRAGVIARLTRSERVSETEAERLVSGWEHDAERADRQHDSIGYWDDAWRWIEEQRKRRVDDGELADKTDMSAVGDDGQVFGG